MAWIKSLSANVSKKKKTFSCVFPWADRFNVVAINTTYIFYIGLWWIYFIIFTSRNYFSMCVLQCYHFTAISFSFCYLLPFCYLIELNVDNETQYRKLISVNLSVKQLFLVVFQSQYRLQSSTFNYNLKLGK